MKSRLALLSVVAVSLSVSAGPVKASSESLAGSNYGNCARLNKVYPRGVAISSSKARLQKVKPAVNRGIYLKNIKLDKDKDGTACEKTSAEPNLSTVPPVPANTTATPIAVTCPTSQNVLATIDSASDGSYRTTGASIKYYYFMRNVIGTVRNLSDVRVQVYGLSISGNLMRGSIVEQSQTVSVFNNVYIEPKGVYGWSKSYEALGHRTTWSDYSTVERKEAIQNLTFVSADSRCS